MSIRTKFTLVMTVVLAIVSLAVYAYFPGRLHRQIVGAVAQKSAALTGMAAYSVADGLQARNPAAVAAALAGVRNNPDLTYFILLDDKSEPFASFNDLVAAQARYETVDMKPVDVAQRSLQAGTVAHSPQEVIGGPTEDGTVYQAMSPVRHHGRRIGRLYTGMSLRGANADAARSRTTIALVTLLAFLLGTGAVFALSTIITGPLQRMAETSEGIAAGDFTKRADVTGDDEVGQLARAFNGMVDRVAEMNRTLEERVAQRTHELTVSKERYRLLFEQNLAGVYVATESGRIIDCNEACVQLFRYPSREEFLARGSIDYLHPHHRESVVRRLREQGAVVNEEIELRARDGEGVWVLENVRRVVPVNQAPVLEGILLDITDRKRAEDEITFKAYHDALTGLPNRALFLDRLSIALAHAHRNGGKLAVLFLDLDDMKSINDTFGHAVGDRALKSLADCLVATLRREDTVARVGGDEFLILLEVADSEHAEKLARRILNRICEPLSIDRDELYVTTSIGVAIYPDDADTADALIRQADGAMYRVKEGGGNNVQLSSREARRAVGRLSLEEQIRTAFDNDEFILYYQPQVQLQTRVLSGAEALVRWQRPDGTVLAPSSFLPVCETSGLITELGDVVLRKACEQMVAWQKQGSAPPRMGVNVSARQFYQRDFTGAIERVLAETGMSPLRLELEITETVAMQTTDRSLSTLRHFREMGIAIAVDDFGTGQSSLSYLKRFPVDTVKIDRSFVQDIISGENDEWIITAILMLANHLGLRTVAEGVESEIQSAFLGGHDCREIQGYLISKPIPPDEFAERFLVKSAEERTPRVALL
jgi:diguanylate cyclase (GGDEF)-like protein/PAS domain S-box-containing protein